jgi:ParB family chromosome partitioning protein
MRGLQREEDGMSPAESKFAQIPVAELQQGENVRFELRELEELADDIRLRGVIQPLVVVPNEAGDGAEVLVGHRRLAAAALAGLKEVPCVLRSREPDMQRMLTQISENSIRLDLTPMEQARCCQALTDQGLTPREIATQWHKSDTWVINRLRLLELPECLQKEVHEGRESATRALDALPHLRDKAEVRRLEKCLANRREGDFSGLSKWWQERYTQQHSSGTASKQTRGYHREPALRWSLVACANCAIEFQIPWSFWMDRMSDHETFYCPAGHSLRYGENS